MTTVLVARPLWPVLRRIVPFLAAEGYRVEEAPSWSRLVDAPLSCPGLAGVFLGEHGAVTDEVALPRRLREAGGGGGHRDFGRHLPGAVDGEGGAPPALRCSLPVPARFEPNAARAGHAGRPYGIAQPPAFLRRRRPPYRDGPPHRAAPFLHHCRYR